jgi:hypothetical protein
VSRAALLEIDRDIALREIREITVVQISLSVTRLITYSRNSTAELTLILSEINRVLNRKRSLKRISRLFREGRY